MLRRVFLFDNVFVLAILWIVFYRPTVCLCSILTECIAILTRSLVTFVTVFSVEIVVAAFFFCFVAFKARVLSAVLSIFVATFFALLFIRRGA